MLQHSPRRTPARLPATWLVAALLLLGGCALFHVDAPVAGLQQRILPPVPILPDSGPVGDGAFAVDRPPEPRPSTLTAVCDDSAVPLEPLLATPVVTVPNRSITSVPPLYTALPRIVCEAGLEPGAVLRAAG